MVYQKNRDLRSVQGPPATPLASRFGSRLSRFIGDSVGGGENRRGSSPLVFPLLSEALGI